MQELDETAMSTLPDGGLLSCEDCSVIVVSGCSFSRIVGKNGGVIRADYSNENSIGEIIVEDSEFHKCEAKSAGGVLYTTNYIVSIRQSLFTDNRALYGAAVAFQSTQQLLTVSDSVFLRNSAELEGSCVRWTGPLLVQENNTCVNNSALYGNPWASTPHHFLLLETATMLPLTLPVVGVTGQKLERSLTVGVFDVLDQLLVTDNSTVLSLSLPDSVVVSGTTAISAFQGLASFTLMFSPYSDATINMTVSATSVGLADLVFPYRFRPCVAGEIRADSGCFPCQKNSYSFNSSDPVCALCPAHAQCYGRTNMSLDAEYWRTDTLTDDIYECLVPEACLGGADSFCATGYTATLCGACEEGYYKTAQWHCVDCETDMGPVARGVFIGVLVLTNTMLPALLIYKSEGWLYRLGLVYRVYLNYSQQVLFVVLLHEQWDWSVLVLSEVFRAFGSLGAVLVNWCPPLNHFGVGEYYLSLLVVAFYPLLLVFSVCALLTVANIKLHFSIRKLLQVMAVLSLVAVYNFLPVMSLVAISLYQCQVVAGSAYLVSDLSQVCWQDAHLLYSLTVALPLLVLCTLLLFFFQLLLRYKPSQSIVKEFRSYLTAGFKPRCQDWELRIQRRKLVMLVLALAYPKLDAFTQTILLNCVLGGAIHKDVRSRPFDSSYLNTLHLLNYISLFALVYTANSAMKTATLCIAAIGSFLVLFSGVLAVIRGDRKERRPANNDLQSSPSGLSGLGHSSCEDLIENSHIVPPPCTPVQVSSSIVDNHDIHVKLDF